MVYADPVLYANVQAMFAEAHRLKKRTPLDWEPEPQTFDDFLVLLNEIMFTAPEAYQTGRGKKQDAARDRQCVRVGAAGGAAERRALGHVLTQGAAVLPREPLRGLLQSGGAG